MSEADASPQSSPGAGPKLLVLGLGNPLLGDDGLGWRLVDIVQTAMERLSVDVDVTDRGGLALMERLVGYDRALLIDAVSTGRRPPGAILACRLEELPDPAAGHLHSAHDTSLQSALELGRRLGLHVPQIVEIVAVEIAPSLDFSSSLSAAIVAALPDAANAVLASAHRLLRELPSESLF